MDSNLGKDKAIGIRNNLGNLISPSTSPSESSSSDSSTSSSNLSIENDSDFEEPTQIYHVPQVIQENVPVQNFPVNARRVHPIHAPSKLAAGVLETDLLMNVPTNKYGTLLGFDASVEFLPTGYENRIRAAFSLVMDNVVENKNDVNRWKQLLLVSSLLLTHNGKPELALRLGKIMSDNWNFTVKELLSNQDCTPVIGNRSDKLKNTVRRVSRYMRSYHISKAMDVILNNEDPVAHNADTFAKLESKHPVHPDYTEEEQVIYDQVSRYQVSEESRITVSAAMMLEVVHSSKNLIRPGLDKLRYDHLKRFVGIKKDDQSDAESRFTNSLAKLTELIVNGDFPNEIAEVFRDNELLALPKPGSDDVRPIGVGITFRKLASLVISRKMQNFTNDYMNKFQYVMRRNGCESIQISLKEISERNPFNDMYTIDADNAFNRVNRLKGITEIIKHCPEISSFVKAMYLEKSKGWYYGLHDAIKEITSSMGFHQGCVLASWLYAMTTYPLLVHMDETIRREFGDQENLQKFYADDGNLNAPRPIMYRMIEILQAEGPKYGYHIKANKGAYLIGKCASCEEAQNVSTHLQQTFRISPNVIQVHPDNVHIDQKEIQKKRYGFKVLGSFVGTDEYVKEQLDVYYQSLEDDAVKLMEYPDYQTRMLLFRKSFLSKPVHIFRTIPPDLTEAFVEQFEALKKKIICSIVGFANVDELTDLDYKICRLKFEEGGLSIQDTRIISKSSFVASMVDYHNQYEQCLTEKLVDVIPGSYLSKFVQEAQQFVTAECPTLQDIMKITRTTSKSTQNQLSEVLSKRMFENVKAEITARSSIHRVFFNGLCNHHAGKWLEAMPVHAKLVIVNTKYRAALRYRMNLRPEGFVAGMRCYCHNHPYLDEAGHHLASGCTVGAHTIFVHDNIKNSLNGILRRAGNWTKLEERGMFEDGKRPDITIYNFNGTAMSMLLDVSVTTTTRYNENGVAIPVNVNDVGKYAEVAKRSKVRKYGEECTARGFGFKAFILESNGYVHPDAVSLLKTVAKASSEVRKLDEDTLFNYYMKLISVSLQIGLAEAIIGKLDKLNRRGHRDYALDNDDQILVNERLMQ